MTSLAAMPGSHSSLGLFPGQTRSLVLQQILVPTREFSPLPFVDRDTFGIGREIVPKILHKLQLLRGAEFKDRLGCRIHNNPLRYAGNRTSEIRKAILQQPIYLILLGQGIDQMK
jgi:hypothetical protein